MEWPQCFMKKCTKWLQWEHVQVEKVSRKQGPNMVWVSPSLNPQERTQVLWKGMITLHLWVHACVCLYHVYMLMCKCVCECVCMYVYMFMDVFMHVWIEFCICELQVFMCVVCTLLCFYACACACAYLCLFVSVYACVWGMYYGCIYFLISSTNP